MGKFVHLDADESIFFARQLEYVKKKSYDVQYPELKARMLLPVSSEAGPGAETIKYEQYDQVGMAKIINSYADDLPRADIKGKEFISPIRSAGTSYGYTLQEVRAARYANKPLEQRKANAAKRAALQLENTIAFSGSAVDGLGGFINNANVPTVSLPNDGTGSSVLWSAKTPALILRDLHKVANFVMENTKTVEQADTMILPPTKFNYIKTTPWSTTGDGKSILDLFLEQSPYIKSVDWANELTGAGSGATDRMVVYSRNPDKLTLEIPQDFEQLEVEQRNLKFVVPCHMRVAGVIIYYPLSMAYADGF
jgi:hypothetical protein